MRIQATVKTKTRQRIDEFCRVNYPEEEIVLWGGEDGDPYDEGLIGVGYQQHKGPVAIYDREKCILALADEFAKDCDSDHADSDPYTQAVEWFDFNTAGSWIGDQTPIIVDRLE
jgi:hypothetical protein